MACLEIIKRVLTTLVIALIVIAPVVALSSTPARAKHRDQENVESEQSDDAAYLAPASNAPAGKKASVQALDRIMRQALRQFNIKGGALAVTKNGKLVYARGFGQADVAKDLPFTPTTLSNVASVTKAFNAVAVLKLAESGKINLDDTLYNVLGRPVLPRHPEDKRVYQITIRQLLHHSGGWIRQSTHYSPKLVHHLSDMSQDGSVSFKEILLNAMCLPLDYTPGTECHYSNFQFAIVSYVIEKVSGMEQTRFVQRNVLNPAGIKDMRFATKFAPYFPNQAIRYNPNGEPIPQPNHQGVAVSGPLGCWTASVVDLARFLTAIEGSRVPGYLNAQSIKDLTAAPAPPAPSRSNGKHFGLGTDIAYMDKDGKRFFFCKNGGIAGARAFIAHWPDNTDYAILLNGGGKTTSGSALDCINNLVKAEIPRITDWSKKDLFDTM